MKNKIEIENKGGSFPDSKVSSFESLPFVWRDEEKPDWMHSEHWNP
jgi:hypothetical protein